MGRHQGAGSFFVVREIWIWIVGLGRGSGARRGRARGLPTFFTCPYSLSLSSPNIDISHDPPSSDAAGVTAVWRPSEPRGSFSPVLSDRPECQGRDFCVTVGPHVQICPPAQLASLPTAPA